MVGRLTDEIKIQIRYSKEVFMPKKKILTSNIMFKM